MKPLRFVLTCATLLSLLCPAFAKVGDKVSWPDFDTGHIYGKTLSAADLHGKVVFFEYWGIACPPCRAAMPHLIEMQKKYGSKGLVVIGSHVQFMSPAVKTYLEENKVNFPIYSFKTLREAPCPGAIPYSVLIGGDGRIIAEGMPSTLYGRVEDALAQAAKGFPILNGVELGKYKSLEKSLVTGAANVEGKVEALRAAASGGDAEAQAICDAYDAWLEAEKQRIASQCENAPLQALRSIAVLKKSVPSCTDFDAQAQAFREGAVYQKLAAVQKKLDALNKRQEQGKRISAGQIKTLRKAVQELRGMEGKGVSGACDSMEAELESLAGAVEETGTSRRKKRA